VIIKKYNIFLVVPNSATIPSTTKSYTWKNNLYAPLVKMGHEVVLLDYEYDDFFVHAENRGWLKRHSTEFSDILWRTFKQKHHESCLDLCFVYLCDGFVDYEVLNRIRGCGVPIINYSCNNIHQFHLVQHISQVVDCNIYAELHAGPKFAAIGAKAVQMQMAANPDIYRPIELAYQYAASFLGQRYADRGELMSALILAGIDAYAFGPRWRKDLERVGNVSIRDRIDKLLSVIRTHGVSYAVRYISSKYHKTLDDNRENIVLAGHVGGILTDDAMVRLFSESKINLGFATVYSGGREGGVELYHLRLRDFEIPMCGGFYLTRYTEELEDYFEIGKEIECYRDPAELIDKCRYYLNHESKREEIRRAGLARSLACHTWNRRFNDLFAHPTISSLLRN
jgi:spore maturation protein CgeB